MPDYSKDLKINKWSHVHVILIRGYDGKHNFTMIILTGSKQTYPSQHGHFLPSISFLPFFANPHTLFSLWWNTTPSQTPSNQTHVPQFYQNFSCQGLWWLLCCQFQKLIPPGPHHIYSFTKTSVSLDLSRPDAVGSPLSLLAIGLEHPFLVLPCSSQTLYQSSRAYAVIPFYFIFKFLPLIPCSLMYLSHTNFLSIIKI